MARFLDEIFLLNTQVAILQVNRSFLTPLHGVFSPVHSKEAPAQIYLFIQPTSPFHFIHSSLTEHVIKKIRDIIITFLNIIQIKNQVLKMTT